MDPESPAPFSAADIKFIQGFIDSLRRDIASGRHYGGLAKTLLDRLESFEDASIKDSSWGAVVCVPNERSPTNDQTMIRISGPFPNDDFEVLMDSTRSASEVVRDSSPNIT